MKHGLECNSGIGNLMKALLFVLLIAPVQVPGATAPVTRKTDQSTILYLFQHQLFKSLTARLEAYQSGYDADILQEDICYDAFDAFSKTDTASEPLFSRWINEYPDSYVPYAARAKYFFTKGRIVRGTKWGVEKFHREYLEMEWYFGLALADIQEALRRNPRLDICYAIQIEIAGVTAQEEKKNEALAGALKIHPYAFRVRYVYLMTLIPRLGGTYDLMNAFIDRCVKDSVFNPRLKELTSAIPADQGHVCSYLGKYQEAVTKYTEALQRSKMHSLYADRGDAYVRLNDYTSAWSDYESALELSPHNPDYLNRQSNARARQERISRENEARQYEAQHATSADLSLISERQAINKHMEQGNNNMRDGHFEEAVAEYSEVIRLAPYEFTPWYNRGTCYLQLRNEEAALQDFRHVIELKPEYWNAYFRVTLIYANRGQFDDALVSINNILAKEPNNVEGLFYRAKIYERKGLNVEALVDMQRACDLGYEKACRYYQSGKMNGAR